MGPGSQPCLQPAIKARIDTSHEVARSLERHDIVVQNSKLETAQKTEQTSYSRSSLPRPLPLGVFFWPLTPWSAWPWVISLLSLSLSPLSSSPQSPLEDFAIRVRQRDLVLPVPGLKFSDPPLQSPRAPRLSEAEEAFLAIGSTKNQQGPGGYLYQEAPSLLGTCGFQQHFPPSFRLSLIEVSLGQTTCDILCHSFIHLFIQHILSKVSVLSADTGGKYRCACF